MHNAGVHSCYLLTHAQFPVLLSSAVFDDVASRSTLAADANARKLPVDDI
jgi:hypothetical protein